MCIASPLSRLSVKVKDKISIGDRIMRKQGFAGSKDPARELQARIGGTQTETERRAKAPAQAPAETFATFEQPAHARNIASRRI